MKNKIFIDTNILVYAFVDNNMEKHNKARQMIYEKRFDDLLFISTQTIGEFSATLARNRIKTKIIEKYFHEIINSFSILKIDINTFSNAYFLKDKYSLSWWDSVIVSTALENECNVLYSEDFGHVSKFEKALKVVNPLM